MAENKIILENEKSGTSDWFLDRPALNREIEGYASKCSVNKGESVTLFVNTLSEKFTMSLYRMGWYNGLGGRLVLDAVDFKGTAQQIPKPNKTNGLVDCDWVNGFDLQIDSNWTTGVYLVKLEEQTNLLQSYIIFIVRDDACIPEITFQIPITTYQAYNYWGGKNLYEFGSGSDTNWGAITGTPATKVSFNRPFARSNNNKAAYGMGAGDFFTNNRPVSTHGYPIKSAGWDYNMVRWLERNGYDLGYVTSIDTHQGLASWCKGKIFMSHGHDEYWTHEMRSNVTKLRDTGTNLMFVSSNTMFWQIRLEKSAISNQPNRIIVSYKDAEADPVKGLKSTVNFRNVPEQGSEASLIGINYVLDPVMGDIMISNAAHWVFKDTGLKNGSKLKGLLGYEVDALAKNSPPNVITLASSVCQTRDKHNVIGVISYMYKKIMDVFANPISKTLKIATRIVRTLISLVLAVTLLATWYIFPNLSGLIMSGIAIFIVLMLVWLIKIWHSGKVTANMSIYQASSNSYVFATGSMQWSWGLDDYNAPLLRSRVKSAETSIITKNIISKFLET